MSISDMIEGKRQWRAHMARVKALPHEYQVVYREMQKYLFKVGPVGLAEDGGILMNILELFEDGVVRGKQVLEITGKDVASFCDELIGDSKTYAETYQESANQSVDAAMKKSINKANKKG
jgi:DNA-binding ferritin-like protein (Dps family)